ncbi:hypothetical protein [Variovorax paradoxus]|uniref:hypothetical protein n=1 Tax=Variovorax paradoxus TaxID=34073 RepID=UPI003D64C6F5
MLEIFAVRGDHRRGQKCGANERDPEYSFEGSRGQRKNGFGSFLRHQDFKSVNLAKDQEASPSLAMRVSFVWRYLAL